MSLVSGIVTFFMIWWTVLFAVLPWGNRPSDQVETGHVASAPDKPRLIKKFIATTFISCILWGIVYFLISANIFSFYDKAEKMAIDDGLVVNESQKQTEPIMNQQ